MSSERHYVDDNHYRTVSDDGKTSWLYEHDGGLWGSSHCIEVSEHHSDGTTKAYDYDGSFLGSLFHGGKGDSK